MYLCDTNVLSEETKKQPDHRVLAFLSRQEHIQVSAISVTELEYGIALASGDKKRRLLQWLEALLASTRHQVLPIDTSVARAVARLRHASQSKGRQRSLPDLIIAATALVSGSVVATRNTSDFEGLGIALINPFE